MNQNQLAFFLSEENISKNKHYIFIIFTIMISLISFTGLNGSLQNMDECLYATIARDTFNSHSLIPLKNGSPYLHKSPFLFWFISFSYKIFGINDFAAKFPSAFSNLITGICITLISYKIFNSYLSGILAAFIYNTSLQVYASTHQVAIDSLMVMTVLVSLLFVIKGFNENKNWFLLAALFNGLTFLTKSVMGLIIPTTLILFLISQKRWDVILYVLFYILITFSISSPYFIYIHYKYPQIFSESFLSANIISRFYPHNGFHLKNIYNIIIAAIEYMVLILAFTLPFTPGLIYTFLKRLRINTDEPLIWGKKSKILSIYFLIVFIGFSISSANGVWPHYTLPMLPAVFIILSYTLLNVKKRNILLLFSIVSFITILVFIILVSKNIRKYPTYIDVIIGLVIIYMIFAILNLFLYVKKIDTKKSIITGILIFFISFIIMTSITVPLDFNADIKKFSKLKIDKSKPLIIINTNEVNEGHYKRRPVYWYMKMRSQEYNTFDSFLKHSKKLKHGTYILYYKGYTNKLEKMYSSFEIIEKGKIWNIAILK